MRAVMTVALVAGLGVVPGVRAQKAEWESGRGGEWEHPGVLGLPGLSPIPGNRTEQPGVPGLPGPSRAPGDRALSAASGDFTAGARGLRAVSASSYVRPVASAESRTVGSAPFLPLSHTPTLPLSPFGVENPGRARPLPAPGRFAAPQMTIAQLQYEGGGDWYANPTGLPNLLTAIRTRTGLPVSDRPAHVKITDPDLWQYPYLYMTGHGNVHFTDEEVQRLRDYLDAGGFLHADDNYGMDVSFRREIRRVFPDARLVELPKDHPIYHLFYDFPRGLPKIHKHDGTPAQGFGIFHNGRLVVFYSYESDLGNGWEDPQTYGDPPALHEAALRMGVNLFMYATSQVPR